MAQLIPLPLTISCSSKIQTGFTFWYRLTQVIPDKVHEGHKMMCECVCDSAHKFGSWSTRQHVNLLIQISQLADESIRTTYTMITDANFHEFPCHMRQQPAVYVSGKGLQAVIYRFDNKCVTRIISEMTSFSAS